MGLRAIAEADLATTLEDAVGGFGVPIIITDPDGNVGNLIGFGNDIAEFIDPDTGQAVTGRMVSAVVRISSLATAQPDALGIPVGIADASKKPWQVQFDDVNGNTINTKVQQSNPDRALGIVSLLLEIYVP